MLNQSKWIFGSFQQDVLWLLLPGPILFLTLSLFGPSHFVSGMLIFIVFAFLDSGHVYLTWWRTFFNPKERTQSKLYLVVPLSIIIIFTFLFITKFSYLWSFVLYATAYHYIRQVLGFYHIYQRGKARNRIESFILFLLIFIPFLTFHTRPNLERSGFYTRYDLLTYPSESLYKFLIILFLIVQIIFLLNEAFQYAKSRTPRSTALYIFVMSWFFILIFNTPNISMTTILACLIGSHTIPYSKLIQSSLNKTKPIKLFNNKYNTIVIIILTLIILGGTEAYIEKNYIDFERVGFNPIKALLQSLYLTPLFFHFIFDGIIWKRKHHEFPHY